MNRSRSGRRGRRAEWAAALYLLLRGYRIRHRNWEGGGGELDLVVSRGGILVFVEVKMRSVKTFGGAVQAVDGRKRRRLVRAAGAYLTRFGLWQAPSRFDIVTVERRASFPWWRIEHMPGAFRPDLGRRL